MAPRRTTLAFCTAVGMALASAPAPALDTLRVGLNGNLSWTGVPFGTSVKAVPPEHKVERRLTLIGNAPGNLIDLQRLRDPAPRVLIKTVLEAPETELPRLVESLSASILEVLAPVPRVAATEVVVGGNLFTILVTFEAGTDLGEGARLVDEAVEAIRPASVAGGGGGTDAVDERDCSEETREFESTATVTEEWGDCQSFLGGTRGFETLCYRVVCKDRNTAQITSTPGRLTGKPVAGKPGAVQQPARLPEGINPVVLPEALAPAHVAAGENVAQRAVGWDGRISAPAITDVSRSELEAVLLELIVPGGREDAFQRKGSHGALGTFVVLDLGAPIGVNRIRFYPRNTVQPAPDYAFQGDFLRQFELMVHDGSDLVLDGTGRLVPQLQDYEVVRRTVDNQLSVVDVAVSPAKRVRFVRLKSISSFPYELDELEVFGQGFISRARYLSPVYDLGAPATWGNIAWVERFVDLARDAGAGAAGVADNCDVATQQFTTAEEIPETWGACETASHYRDGVGYVTVWNCFQTTCRDESGARTVTPGVGKAAARSASKATQAARRDLSRVAVRTRTGSDPTPLLYWRRNVERASEEEQSGSLLNPFEQLGRDEYLKLAPDLDQSPPKVWDKGEVTDDLDQWSPWSAPYLRGSQPGGEPILSPGPRRYFQFSVDFENDAIDATKMLEQLSVGYLLPPIADDLIGEIYPREVDAFETIPFTYAVRALMNIDGVKGFDSFEIATPARILGIDRIQIIDGGPDERVLAEHEVGADIVVGDGGQVAVQLADGTRRSLPYEVTSAAGTFAIESVRDDGFVVRFPKVERPAAGGQRLVKIDFRSRVLLFSTVFRGAARSSAEAGTVQRVTPGNAAFLGEGDLATASGITVLSPSITSGSLVGAVQLEPNPFTPNGDGANDALGIAYDIMAVTRAAEVEVRLFDLGGRLVRSLYRGSDLSGHYDATALPALSWDGRDDGGRLVPPGVYVLSIRVEGDARDGEQVRAVAVVY